MIDSPLRVHEHDLEPPIKQRPIIVEVTTEYVVWVDDWEDVGPERLVQNLQRGDVDVSDLLEGVTASNADWRFRAVDGYLDRVSYGECGRHFGPFAICPMDGCTTPGYPAYGFDTAGCARHTVPGCQNRRLPEKTEWP